MGWLDKLHGLLAEDGGGECPACGREKRRGAPYPGTMPIRLAGPKRELGHLCAACLEKIPWIRRAVCPVCGRPERCGDCLRRTDRQFALCRGAVRYDEVMKDWLWQYKYRGLEKLEPVMAAMLAAAAESVLGTGRIGVVTSVPLASERLEERGFNQAERMAQRISLWYGVPYVPLLRRVRNSGKMSFLGRKDRFENMRGNFVLTEESGLVLEGAMRERNRERTDCRASRLNRLGRKERSFDIRFGGNASGLTRAVSLIRRNNAAEPAASSSGMASLHVLIVDDIYTTGTTMNECAAALKASPAIREVYGALWARS